MKTVTFIQLIDHLIEKVLIVSKLRDVDRIVRDETGRCIARWIIVQFNYTK